MEKVTALKRNNTKPRTSLTFPEFPGSVATLQFTCLDLYLCLQYLFHTSAVFTALKLFLIVYTHMLYIWFLVNRVLTEGQFDNRKSSLVPFSWTPYKQLYHHRAIASILL